MAHALSMTVNFSDGSSTRTPTCFIRKIPWTSPMPSTKARSTRFVRGKLSAVLTRLICAPFYTSNDCLSHSSFAIRFRSFPRTLELTCNPRLLPALCAHSKKTAVPTLAVRGEAVLPSILQHSWGWYAVAYTCLRLNTVPLSAIAISKQPFASASKPIYWQILENARRLPWRKESGLS